MVHCFAELAFTPSVKKIQDQQGSRASYARMEAGQEAVNYRLTEMESSFISARDSFYMATVGETGWPYIQHRGGPEGFVTVIDQSTIGFADFRGNRQYISVGNLATNDRVSLFFMDYSKRRRLKLLGRARVIGLEDQETLSRLEPPRYRARVERGILIKIEGFDWNCPQHIVERYARKEVSELIDQHIARISEQESELSQRNAQMSEGDRLARLVSLSNSRQRKTRLIERQS